MPLNPGQTIDGKYRVVRKLGAGGMGAVYLVENLRIGRRVALKVLHPGADGEAVLRFEREAQAAGRIGCLHIVEVFDLGNLPDGSPYMVMEYLEGETLAERLLDRGRLTIRELVPITHQMLEGLKAAHGAGIVHRDLKPENVFLAQVGSRELVKLLDFGISKVQGSTSDAPHLTRPGCAIGTPHYMSPEQACGEHDVDQRSDLYSAGVILYRSLSGRFPFDAETLRELVLKVVGGTPARLDDLVAELAPAWSELVSKAMARAPDDRFQSAEEFQRALWRTVPRPADYADTMPHGWLVGLPTDAPLSRTASLGSTMRGMAARSVRRMGKKPWPFVLTALVGGALGVLGMLALRWQVPAPPASVALSTPAIPSVVRLPLEVPSAPSPSPSTGNADGSQPDAGASTVAVPSRAPSSVKHSGAPKPSAKSGPLTKDL